MPKFTPPSNDMNSVLVTMRELLRYTEVRLAQELSSKDARIATLKARVDALEARVSKLEN